MKLRLTVAAAVIFCLALTTGGTLAYFSAQEKAHNVITSGGVEIDLQEWTLENGSRVPFEDVVGVMPGAQVSKIVEVENTGESAAYMRVSVEKAIKLAEGVAGTPDLGLVHLDFNTNDWTDGGDGWWYYNEAVPAGATTAPLFENVAFAASMNNMYQNSQATIDVAAQAVQVANNGKSALEAAGWPAPVAGE